MKEIKGIKLTEKLETYIKESLNINENEKIGPREVSEADGYYVPTYRELVEQVAILSYINEEYLLFFRGQNQIIRSQIVIDQHFILLYIEGVYLNVIYQIDSRH